MVVCLTATILAKVVVWVVKALALEDANMVVEVGALADVRGLVLQLAVVVHIINI